MTQQHSPPEVHIPAGLVGSVWVSIRSEADDSARGGTLVLMASELDALPDAIAAAVARYRAARAKAPQDA